VVGEHLSTSTNVAINANSETVRDLPTFRDAYRLRRRILPVDGFHE
jgi:putative SOS response-associated peptidase YedK